MTFTPVETIALIFIVVVAIKLLVIMTNPKKWMTVIRKVWGAPGLVAGISLILSGLVLYYLLDSGITIIQILAVSVFVALISAISIAAYSQELIKLAEKMLKDKAVIRKAWLAILIWIVLIIWGISTL